MAQREMKPSKNPFYYSAETLCAAVCLCLSIRIDFTHGDDCGRCGREQVMRQTSKMNWFTHQTTVNMQLPSLAQSTGIHAHTVMSSACYFKWFWVRLDQLRRNLNLKVLRIRDEWPFDWFWFLLFSTSLPLRVKIWMARMGGQMAHEMRRKNIKNWSD